MQIKKREDGEREKREEHSSVWNTNVVNGFGFNRHGWRFLPTQLFLPIDVHV